MRVEGRDEAANPVFSTADADDYLILDSQGRERNGVTRLTIRDDRFPEGMAAFDVDGHKVRVEGTHVEGVAQNRQAAVVRAAAYRHFRIVVVVIDPEHPAGDGVERDYVVRPLGHVHDS